MINFSSFSKRFFTTLLFASTTILAFSQFDKIEYDDVIYEENIHSVRFYPTADTLGVPIIELGSNETLTLNFDDLGDENKDLYYKIIHCNADWQPSDLTTLEYLEGFEEHQLEDYDFSINTLTDFNNYHLTLPNEDLQWTKSGNYVLVIFEYGNDEKPVFTRRFLVVEPLVKIEQDLVRPTNVQKAKTHQEIDFSILFQGLVVKDARREIRAAVLQNGRWDNAITDISPRFEQGEKVIFDYQDKIIFPAGKEFRYIDMRSLRFKNERIIAIEEYEDLYEVTLQPDRDWAYAAYQYIRDANGIFLIQNIHLQAINDNDLESDYALVLFSIEKKLPYETDDIYLFGKMTDWKIQEKFKLAYSDKLQLYAADVLLKQGYYNYTYAVVPRGTTDTNKVNIAELQGDWYETENEYTILIYHRAFGGRYDRLVGVKRFGSND